MENEKLTKSVRKRYVLAILTLYIVLSSFIIGLRVVWTAPTINDYTVTPNSADVGEELQFSWDISGYQQILINFGDSSPQDVTGVSTITHTYATEGSYDTMLTAIDSSGDYVVQTINVLIKNEAPEFDFTTNATNNIAYEDELVEINITDLVESDVDIVPGVLKYIYNFADGTENQISTNESSNIHSWSNAGTYPVTVTAIDDQGALNQVTKDITVKNYQPSANINIGHDESYAQATSEYFSTYNWKNDSIGSPPEGWNIFNSNPLSNYLRIVDSSEEIHYKVVELQDNSNQESISMENSFNGQEYGTIELWVKSNDVSSKTWALSLWDNSQMGFQVLINEGNWQYTTSTSYVNLFPSLIGEIDIWYHVRIDFCADDSSGEYNNLRAGQFRAAINDFQSNIFNITNPKVFEINKIKIETGTNDIGISWIDAIGYSWDPNYNTGNNRWPVTAYRDNIMFLFDGSNSDDTESDLNSLDYFWQFGDGSTSYGKYVHHQYSKPGVYKVGLMVKDDNGDFDLTMRYVSVNNMKPSIDILSLENSLSIYEGETIAFNTNVSDNLGHMFDLEYWWNFEFDDTEFNPYNFDNFVSGGWRNSHIYMDDYNGSMYVVAKDSEGFTDHNSLNINVLNVDPSVSIWDAGMLANTTLIISRSSEELDADFDIALLENNEPMLILDMVFNESDNNFIYTSRELIYYSLSKYWKIAVNSSSDIPDYSWFKYDFILQFQNGQELVISSGKLYGGSAGYWEDDINPYFYENYSFKYPLDFSTHIWDPSKDDIDLNVEYDSNLFISLASTTGLPGGYSTSINYNFNDANYDIHVFEQTGIIFANISVKKIVSSSLFKANSFPISLDLTISIDPLFEMNNLLTIIENDFPLTDVSLLECLEAIHCLTVDAIDDDGGTDSLRIDFDTKNDITFKNLSPKLIPNMASEISEIRNVTVYAQLWDFDQSYNLKDAFLISPINYDAATIINELVCNYTTTSNKVPENMHSYIETNNKTFYIVDSVNTNTLLKSVNEGKDWTTVVTLSNGYEICSLWYDRYIENLYLACSNNTNIQIIKVRLIDDYISYSTPINGGTSETIDVILLNDYLYVGMGNISENIGYMLFQVLSSATMSWLGSYNLAMGSSISRTFKISSFVSNGQDIYYLWQWNDENPTLWRFTISNTSFTNLTTSLISDLLSNTQILDESQKGLTYDGVNSLSFVLNNTAFKELGDYSGTYSFENDDIINDIFEQVNTTGGTANIINDLDGHSQVLEFYDNNPDINNNVHVIKELVTTQNFGTIEYYVRSSDVNGGFCGFRLDNGESQILVNLRIRNGYLQRLNQFGLFINVVAVSNNTWYHLRFDFECTAGGYQGLSQYNWRVYVNGFASSDFPFRFDEPQAARIEWYTDYAWGLSEHYYYIDSIGFSWDPAYEIGKNINFIFPGNYPGTYTFIEDDVPNEPNCFEEVGTIGGTVNVISDLDGHTKILELFDTDVSYNAHVIKELSSNPSYGTIEYWMRTDDVTNGLCGFRLDSGTILLGEMVTLRVYNGYLQKYLGSWQNVVSLQNDTWYHLRVDFECTTGAYTGLSQYNWRLFVNNTNFGISNFINNETYGARIEWYTDYIWGLSGYYYYIDAIGFSWDTDYKIGDNFNVAELGHYPATYSFEDDETPNKPYGFDTVGISGGTVNVITELDGHNKVLELYDTNQTQNAHLIKKCPNMTSGTIEYWMRTDDVKTGLSGFGILGGTIFFNELVTIRIWNNKMQRFNGFFQGWDYITMMENNTWYHIRVDFECTNGSYQGLNQFMWRIYINGVMFGDYDFAYNLTKAVKIRWHTDIYNNLFDYSYFIDAIGFSWDPDYKLGDNIIMESDFHYYTYKIDSSTLASYNQYDEIALMLNRNTESDAFEKAFLVSGTKIYLIGPNCTKFQISEPMLSSSIRAISDSYIITNDGGIYKFLSPYFNGNSSMIYSKGSGQYPIEQDLIIDTGISSRYSSAFEGLAVFESEGYYLISMIANDGTLISTLGKITKIDFDNPFATIGEFSNSTVEDQQILLSSNINIFGNDEPFIMDYLVKWDFGDGTYSYDQNPGHSWSIAGTYNITLSVIDCYGNIFITNKTIIVEESAPEIEGPFYFQGIEGHAVIFDIGIYDSIIDEKNITYTWYNDQGIELLDLKDNKKPTIILNDGEYVYELEVEDQDGYSTSTNITLFIEDIPPIVMVSNYGYYGDLGGTLEFTSYVFDYIDDIDNMYFDWTLYFGKENITYNSVNSGFCNTFLYSNYINQTGFIGEINVTDSIANKSAIKTFRITNLIDSNKNNFPDDYEWMVEECGYIFNISVAYNDEDFDNLIDDYETSVSYTDPSNPDTDNDGLWDGYDVYGFGERPFKTDPNNNDTDSDSLLDGTELFGWNINVEILGEIHVISNPLRKDTDRDRLSDYQEFEAGTNPRNRDTDRDGLRDNLDPFPLKRDEDEDGLSDFLEYIIGTNMNGTDTDGDSITDGQEVFGWGFKTNPLSADSDNDFLADSAEVKTYSYKLDTREDLDESVYLRFQKSIRKALSAQISICVVFGEVSFEGEGYGIADVPDLTVTITKSDSNLILYQDTTNKSRYFSKSIDIKEILENNSLNYRGRYKVEINNTAAGCILEQFTIDVAGYLNPNNPDCDNDKIMDGIEMGLLVNGTNSLDFKDIYTENNLSIHYSVENSALMHYNGTASFEDDIIGNDPSWFDVVNENGGTVQVKDGIGGHAQVVELFDNDPAPTYNAYVMKNVSTVSPTYGTIEYWMRIDNAKNKLCGFRLDNGAVPQALVTMRVWNNFLQRDTGISFENIIPVQNNTWYHFRVDFECTTGSYRGLAQYTWRLFVNDKRCGVFTFINNELQASNIVWYTDFIWGLSNYYYYIDAIGLSWDPTYLVGDNLIGENGSYLLEQGYYMGTYSFENDTVGNNPTDWMVEETGGVIQVVEEVDGHQSVVLLNQTSNTYELNISQGFSSSQQTGTIEWWWRTTSASRILELSLTNDTYNLFRFRINDNKFEYNNGSWNDLGLDAFKDTWYHVSLDFECTTGNFSGLDQYSWCVYINGVRFGEFLFENNLSDINEIWFRGESISGYQMYLDAIGYSWDPNYNVGDNWIDSLKIFNEFSIEIPDIGTIYDADLQLEIESNEIPSGSGTVLVELIKEDINNNIDDVTLTKNIENFTNSIAFSFKKYLDISNYVKYGVISKYFGKYRLKVKVYSTDKSDIFNITKFIINADTFVQAGPDDTEAWITDPSKWDTDGDWLSDYNEIYFRKSVGLNPTNPLARDTDGDGTSDFFDSYPLRDLIIEISPIYGFHNSLTYWDFNPDLEISVSFNSGFEFYTFYSNKKAAHESTITRTFLFFSKKLYRKSYFDGTYGSHECHYYVNINDNWLFGSLKIDLGLWNMHNVVDDERLLSETVIYNVGPVGNTETFEISRGHKMAVKFKTIALNKTNTIAIYDESTVFNGHYQTQERMNIVQIYINTGFWTLWGTPFVPGVNTIVIPTSIFTETLLNKHVQDRTLEETALYDEENEDHYQFISVGRNGTTDEACADIDFMFIRFDVNRKEAIDIILLLLSCIINQTTNATAIKYKYASTKQEGYSAELMNLKTSVLGFVPWKCEYQSSAQGEVPTNFWENVVGGLAAVGEFVVGIFVSIGEFFLEIFKAIVEVIGKVLLTLIPFLADLLWCLIRAILLIFVWITFAITLAFLTIGIASIALASLALVALFGAELSYTFNRISFSLGAFSFSLGYDIYMDYYSSFDIWTPCIHVGCNISDITILNIYVKFWPPSVDFNSDSSTSLESQQSTIIEHSIFESIDQIKNLVPINHFSQEKSIKNSDLNTSGSEVDEIWDNFDAILSGITDGFGIWPSYIKITSILLVLPKIYISVKLSGFYLSLIVSIVSVLYQLSSYIENKTQTLLYALGAGIASILTGVFINKYGKPKGIDDYYFTQVKKGEEVAEFVQKYDKATHKFDFKDKYLWLKIIFSYIPTTINQALKLSGLDTPELEAFFKHFNFENLAINMLKIRDAFKILEAVSYASHFQGPDYDTWLKQSMLLPIFFGAALIAFGVYAFLSG